MPRFFNTAGPCRPEIHYTLPSAHRLPLVRSLVAGQNYFVLHAPRQVGKTTTLTNIAAELTAEGTYAAVLVSMEAGAPFRSLDHLEMAERAILNDWGDRIRHHLLPDLAAAPATSFNAGRSIGAFLSAWCQKISRPLVLFLDEIDALQDEVLISVLRQLRSGFSTRPEGFPSSLALVGLRDVRDYKVKSGGSDRLHTSSPFNIKAESLTMGNFTSADTIALLTQHTTETGQRWMPEALSMVYALTRGQPWLVNALARQCTEQIVPDRAVTLESTHVTQARDTLIQRQDTHLDSLAERLREPRVAAVMQAILTGTSLPDLPDDDLRYVVDLGLLQPTSAGGLEVANPIYADVIPRSLTRGLTVSLAGQLPKPTWLSNDGRLDPDKLLTSFVTFWRQHGEPMMKGAPYHEAAPHLVMLAFLSKVANGGGRVEREVAIGTQRMDLLVTYGTTRVALELKVWRELDDPDPLDDGLVQLESYLDGLGLLTGWLVVFDLRPGQPRVAKRTFTEAAVTPAGKTITVVRALASRCLGGCSTRLLRPLRRLPRRFSPSWASKASRRTWQQPFEPRWCSCSRGRSFLRRANSKRCAHSKGARCFFCSFPASAPASHGWPILKRCRWLPRHVWRRSTSLASRSR